MPRDFADQKREQVNALVEKLGQENREYVAKKVTEKVAHFSSSIAAEAATLASDPSLLSQRIKDTYKGLTTDNNNPALYEEAIRKVVDNKMQEFVIKENRGFSPTDYNSGFAQLVNTKLAQEHVVDNVANSLSTTIIESDPTMKQMQNNVAQEKEALHAHLIKRIESSIQGYKEAAEKIAKPENHSKIDRIVEEDYNRSDYVGASYNSNSSYYRQWIQNAADSEAVKNNRNPLSEEEEIYISRDRSLSELYYGALKQVRTEVIKPAIDKMCAENDEKLARIMEAREEAQSRNPARSRDRVPRAPKLADQLPAAAREAALQAGSALTHQHVTVADQSASARKRAPQTPSSPKRSSSPGI